MSKAIPNKDSLQRIRVRADGYDANGAYWGQGPDVFIHCNLGRQWIDGGPVSFATSWLEREAHGDR